jgi:hypothetical protein
VCVCIHVCECGCGCMCCVDFFRPSFFIPDVLTLYAYCCCIQPCLATPLCATFVLVLCGPFYVYVYVPIAYTHQLNSKKLSVLDTIVYDVTSTSYEHLLYALFVFVCGVGELLVCVM